MNIDKLEKNLHLCLVPTEEKITFHCTGSSEKSAEGSSFDADAEFDICLINNSEYDLFVSDLHWDKSIKFEEFPQKSIYRNGSFLYWDFDWANIISMRLMDKEGEEFDIKVDIPKYHTPSNYSFVEMPLLDKKAYEVPFELIYSYKENLEKEMVNSFFYELGNAKKGIDLLDEFISLIKFPEYHKSFKITEGSLFIDLSFGDFGQSDAVIFADNQGRKQTFFIQAKIKSGPKKAWSIQDEFEAFRASVDENPYFRKKGYYFYSELFTQIYYKLRMVRAIGRGGLTELKSGVSLNEYFGKKKRTIGSDEMVLKAVENHMQYRDDVFYVLLVPDTDKNIKDLFSNIRFSCGPRGLEEWKTLRWGYLTKDSVRKFCERHQMTDTLGKF